VEKILVKKGEQVKAGQLLAELDTAALQQIAVQQAQDRLAELNSPASIAAAEQAVAAARKAVDEAQDDADSLTYPRASETLVDHTQSEIDLAKRQLARTSDAYRQVSRLEDGDYRKAEALLAMTNAQLNLNNLTAKYNWYSGKPTDLDAGVIRSTLELAKASLQEAEWYYQALKSGQIPAQASGSLLSRLKSAQDDLSIARTKLEDTRLTAPFAGTVTDINVSAGQFLGPETWVALLADFSQLYVETSDLTEIDVVNISENQPVTVKLDSIPEASLKGKVTSIAQNFSERQGDIVYKVTVLLTDLHPAIRWGMTTQVQFDQ
jgi:HlyD family secretion protein